MFNIKRSYVTSKKVDRMTTAIYFNEMPTQRNARDISEHNGDRNGETAITCVREAKPNSKIEKLKIRLINYENASFDLELLRESGTRNP